MARGAKQAIARRGLMLVLSSPSGAGKTTLSRNAADARSRTSALSVSVTTRRAAAERGRRRALSFHRPQARSTQLRDAGELLEWAEVHGNCYGTPREPVETALAAGPRRAVRHRLAGHPAACANARRDDLVSVFVLPPSSGELARRLHTRAQDDKKVIRARMAKAGDEMSHWAEYDYVVVNRDLDRASATCARSSPPSGSSASDKPACPPSCAACNRNSETAFCLPSAHVALGGAKKHLRVPPHWQRQ